METDPVQNVNLCAAAFSLQIYTAMNTDDLFQLLDARRAELGLSHLQLGQIAFGRPDSSALMGMKRGSSPTFERLEAIARALDLELYLGPRRGRDSGFAEEKEQSDLSAVNALRGGAYLPMPWHPLAKKRGGTPFAFHGDWLVSTNVDPENLALVDPAIIHLDQDQTRDLVVLVDTSANRSRHAQLWAFIDRGRPAVGVLQFEPEAIVLLPHRPGQSARLITGKEREATALLGRVVWQCHINLDPNTAG